MVLISPSFNSDVPTDKKFDQSQMDVGIDIGVSQTLSRVFWEDETSFSARILESRIYVEGVQLKPELKELCRNEHEHCTVWALSGECEVNPTYMKRNCAPACFSCDYLSIEGRCPMDPNATNAWEPGDLDAMFRRLTAEPFLSEYSVEILSSPDTTGGPWVITMENVVKEDEAERLIELGTYVLSTGISSFPSIHSNKWTHPFHYQVPLKGMLDPLMLVN